MFSALEMLGAMEAIGVDRAVIIPPGWWGEDNSLAQAAAEKYPGRFAVMGRIDPYAADTEARLEGWLKQPHMLGIRMGVRWSTSPRQLEEVLQDESLEWYWSACERLGIPLMILTRQYAARIEPVAARHPNLTIILDHLATQNGATVAERFASYDDLRALARHPRVFVKVGNGPNRSDQPFPFEDVHPYLRGIYEAFGPRRMFWEADITQLTKNTYSECLRLWQEGLPFLSAADKDWILGRTAAEVLRWPEPAAAST